MHIFTAEDCEGACQQGRCFFLGLTFVAHSAMGLRHGMLRAHKARRTVHRERFFLALTDVLAEIEC